MTNVKIELQQQKPEHAVLKRMKGTLVNIGQHIACRAQLFLESRTDISSSGYFVRFLVDQDGEQTSRKE